MGLGSVTIPDKVGRYEIVLPIARGGMATVYLARAEGHGGFDRYVALKLTAEHLRDDPEFSQHLIEEAKLVAHLRHTNVVPVLDVGEDPRGVFLVMEYVPGDSLAGLYRVARRRRDEGGDGFPARIGLRVLVDALAGLHAAHEHADDDGTPHSLVHRDFSPQNILVGTDGIARLTDFGIAKASSRASTTVAGTMKGKVSYASPEQARGRPLDRRCDVWAAGVIGWEIIAGRKLYPTSERTLIEIVSAPPPRLREIAPSVTADLEEIIAGALTVDLDRRTPTAQMLRRLLTRAAEQMDMLASVEEVAEYVRTAVAPVLAERKAKIAAARQARVAPLDREQIAAGFDAAADPTIPHVMSRTMPLPSLPDLPMHTHRLDSAATVPASVAAELAGSQRTLPTSRSSLEHLVDPMSSPSLTPAGISAPLLPPIPPSMRPPPADLGEFGSPTPWRQSFLAFQELRQSVSDRIAHAIARRPALVLGVASGIAGVLVLGAVVMVIVSSSASPRSAQATTPSSAPSISIDSSAATAPQGLAPKEDDKQVESAVAVGPQLVVTSEVAVAKVRIGKRTIDMVVPAPEVVIDLTKEEAAATKLVIVATSADGRTSASTWLAGDADVTIDFAKPQGRRPIKASPRKH